MARMLFPRCVAFVHLLLWYRAFLYHQRHSPELLSLVMDILTVQRRDDFSGLSHSIPEPKKLKSGPEWRDMCFLLVECKAKPSDVVFKCHKALFGMVSVMRQQPCIVHVPDVVPCVHLLLHVVIHWVQKRDPGDLNHLRPRIISGAAGILRIQHTTDHLIDVIIKISSEVLFHPLMLHIWIVSMDISLHHPSVKIIVAIEVPEVLLQPFSRKIRSLSFLTCAVIKNEMLCNFRVQYEVIDASLINAVTKRN